jgi:hypothetical protein
MDSFFAKLRWRWISARQGWNLVELTINVLCISGLTILLTPAIGAAQPIKSGDLTPFLMGHREEIIAFVLVGLCYWLLAFALDSFYSQLHPRRKVAWVRWLNPAVISAGEYGTASISSLQLLWFTLIVAFVSIESLLRHRGLPILSESVLTLLGMPAGGKLASIIVTSSRMRLSPENWNWLIENKFLKEGRSIDPRTTATLKDLILTDGAFDPTRYQLFLFSLVIGMAMILGNNLEQFNTGTWNGVLFGSNVVYLGGKALSPTGIKDLDDRVTAIRTSQLKTGVISPISDEDCAFIRKSLTSAYGANAVV